MTTGTRERVDRAVSAVWRIEAGRVIAGLARLVGDVGTAEELAQDAMVIALEQWPESGVPENPGAWLTAVAKHRAVDLLRRRERGTRKLTELGRELVERAPDEIDIDALDDPIGDDRLRLIFTACHPSLSADAQVALILKTLCGLSTEEIARAFLLPSATVAQRIVRAKRTLAERRIRFESPTADQLAERIASVLRVIYLIFNEGYSASAGEDWTRPQLCGEALRLGRILAALVPDEPEVHGLLALMDLQASRIRARHDADGEPILLADQDRRRWDRLLIRHGLEALARAEALGTSGESAFREQRMRVGSYTLQAAIAACHARAITAPDTDWARIATLYRMLIELDPSPVVRLNHAVAVGMAGSPADGLDLLDRLTTEGSLRDYPHLDAARGHLLERLERFEEAREAFEAAAGSTRNAAERGVFLRRAADCGPAR